MALSIAVRSGDTETKPLTFDGQLVVIGRSSGCDVRLPDPSVSQRHATIRRRGSDFLVYDENSTNGTFVGPVRLPPGAPRVLRPGDLVRVGRVWLSFEIEHGAEPSSADDTKELALQLIAGALAADGAPCAPRVSVARGPDPTAAPLTLDEFGHAYVVGRSPQCDFVIADDDLSRRHLEIKRVGGDVLVSDLGSKNGSALDGEPLTRPTKWKGQELTLGHTTLQLDDPLAQVLGEIEASPDEVVDESVEPPPALAEEEETPGAELDPAPARAPSAAGQAPIADAPKRSRAKAKAVKRSSWTTVDLLVAGLAIVVLALSIAGITWLVGE